jgi:hypothetical protein
MIVLMAGAIASYQLLHPPAPPTRGAGGLATSAAQVQIEAVPAPIPLPPPPKVPAPDPPPAAEASAAPEEPALVDPGVGDGLGVITDAEASSVLVALNGPPKGISHYRLADPPGVVITLPRSRPRTPAGAHELSAPFRRVLITKKGPAGSILRIYFLGDPTLQVTPESAAVRVTVRAKRAPRRS